MTFALVRSTHSSSILIGRFYGALFDSKCHKASSIRWSFYQCHLQNHEDGFRTYEHQELPRAPCALHFLFVRMADFASDPLAANAEALKLLSSGLYEPAINILKTSLVGIRSKMMRYPTAPQLGKAQSSLPCLQVSITPTRKISARSTRETSAVFPLYIQAFSFSGPLPEDLAQASSETQARVTAIFMYNTGLAYHQLGLCEQISGCLLAARKYYRLCIKLFRILLSPEPSDYLICMAAINNLGNVAACRHNACDAVEAHSSLRGVLADFNDLMPPSALVNYQDLVYDFWLTALLFGADDIMPLAPAA
jgi:hypothetical protein